MTTINFRELQTLLEQGRVNEDQARKWDPIVRELMMQDSKWAVLHKALGRVLEGQPDYLAH